MRRLSWMMSWVAVTAALLALGCGGRQDPPKKAPPAPKPAPPPEPTTAEAADASVADAQQLPGGDPETEPECASAARSASRGMGVRGITGSLNRGDVQEAMDTRSEALLDCMNRRPRGLRFIGGRIDFLIKVGADGRVCEARPVRSSIGYHRLERCLTEVVEQTHLPLPDGRDRTEVDWGMHVEPDRGRETPEIDPEEIQEAMKQYAAETYKTCEIRRRERFEITAYAGRRGKVLAVGGLPTRRTIAREKLECLFKEIKGWKLPLMKSRSKVTFTLRWKPPPPKRKRYSRSKRRRSSSGRRR